MNKFLILAFLVAATQAVRAQNNYYVTPSGSGSCLSVGSPCSPATVQTVAVSPAIIHFADGTYPDITIQHGGSSAASRFIYQCDNGVASSPAAVGHCRFNGTGVGWTLSAGGNFDIRGFDIGGNGNMFVAINGIPCGAAGHSSCLDSVHILGNYIHDLAQNISLDSSGCSPFGQAPGAILFLNHHGWFVNDARFIGNTIINYGPLPNPACNTGPNGMYIDTQGAVVQNNLIARVYMFSLQYFGQPCNGSVSNNTFISARYATTISGDGEGVCTKGNFTIDNNYSGGMVNGNFAAISTFPCTDSTHQSLYGHNITDGTTPDFVNQPSSACNTTTPNPLVHASGASMFVNYQTNGTGDYHLKPGSPGIGAGWSTCVTGAAVNPCIPPIDIVGVVRPSAGVQDVGAYASTSAGVPIVTFNPSPLAFGTIAISSSSTLTATLANTGSANLTFSAGSVSGTNAADYSITSTTCASPLTAGSSCTYSIRFIPSATGTRSANLTLNDNASGSPHQLPLTGSGGSVAVTVNPTSLTFAATAPGSTSATQITTITNSGSSNLTLTTDPIIGTNPGDFTYGGIGTCSNNQTLAPGSACTISIKFVPTTTGARSATLQVNSTAPSSPDLVALTGTGGAPIVSVSPGSGSCGSVQVGASSTCQAFTLTNTGNIDLTGIAISLTGVAAGSYSQSNNCPATLAASASCTITVFFQPTGSGTLNASLSVASNAAGSPSLIPLSGVGVTPATLTLSPSTVNFGNVVVNSTSAATAITLANAGGTAATISSITASTHFTQTNNCPGSLAGGGNCVISVTATPVATGVLNGTLTVAASAAGSPFVANLSVNGVTPVAVLAPASINFGNQANGSTSAQQNFTLTNIGTSNLVVLSAAITGTNAGDFVLVNTTCVNPITPNSSCIYGVKFAPTTTGARSASLSLTDNASGSPHIAAVSGTGIATAPAVCLNVNSVNFGNQPVNTSSGTQPVVVTNCGTASLVISAVTPTGNFSSTGCVTTVAVNATCTINGTFSPLSAGALTGQFSIASNSASSPDLVSLSGFGTQTGATLTSTAAFGHVVVGITSAIIPLTLTNTGNTSLSLNTPTITGTNPGDFNFGNSCGATLAPNATCQLSATFTPTTTGARSATLTQSFTGGPTSVTSALSGTGDAATPAVTLTPATLDFGSVTTGVQSAIKTVQVQNSGTATLNITSITLTGTNAADYARTNNCGATLAAGAICTVDITVTPGGTGARTSNLHLIDDAADTPQNVTMTTNGVASPAPKVSLSPASLSFSPPSIQTTTTSAARNITATNTGNANLVVSAVTLSGANPGDFTISNNCGTVSAGNTCSATVNCVPTAAGSRTATVSFASNAASSPDTAAISCTGFVGTPTILLAVTNINFGNQTVGTVSGPATFTLTNNGLATATSVAITTVGDFAVTDNCGGSITQGSSCSATVTFSPLVLCGQTDPNDPSVCISNVHLGIVNVVSNTSNSPQAVNLQGTAIPVAPPPGPIIMGVGGKITIGGRLTVN